MQAILSKIGPPSQSTLNTFIDSGMQAPTDHHLTSTEIAELRAAITRLPRLYQRVLAQHLRHLSVVDGIPGEGTGLTAPADKFRRLYDITFRASLLIETLSHFLTTKEQRCFSPDGSRVSVVINAGSMDALTYVFLHEATHVVDFSLGISDRKNNPFSVEIWISQHDLAPPYDKKIISQNVFRTNGHPFGVSTAPQIYRSLSTTPFVSLYASASIHEDLAELAAYHELYVRFHTSPSIEVRDASGGLVYRYEPSLSPIIRHRFALVDSLLKSNA